MNIRSVLPRLGLALAVTLGVVAALPDDAFAEKRNFMCRMKGVWADNPNDAFEFDAAYIWDGGEDLFTGVYDNPGQAKADIKGIAKRGIWDILLTYSDDKHKGMLKRLTGKGIKDPVTHLIKVEGDYKTFLGANDIKHDGKFTLLGTCK
jgi:hypothetical protein